MEEISRRMDTTRSVIGKILRAAGMGGNIAQPLTEDMVRETISKSGFEYVSGYVNSKKNVTVRCPDCGGLFDRQFHIFSEVTRGTRGYGNECPMCRIKSIEQNRTEKQIQKEADKAERERVARINAELRMINEQLRISRQIERRLATRVCKNCGKDYSIASTGYDSEQYCSRKCMKRWAMRIKNDRRLRRMKARKHDNDITLERLFTRDRGICYLCGNQCDWSDVVDGNASDRYPSIDHVVPVSKGGTHTWDNVKLACRKCNTAKGDGI